MNFVVKLEPWLEINGLEHISTTYSLYMDRDLTELVEEITDSDKLFLSITTDIPIGFSYYVLATRHFNIPNIDYTSEVFTITNNGEAINNMILSEPVTIEAPNIIITRQTIDDSDETFTLRTSSYRGKGDGHTHTHWFVYSGERLLFIKLKDVDDKTSIDIPKSIVYGLNQVTFKAIHCSNDIESSIGSYDINFNKVNFEVISQLKNIPITDYTIVFKKIHTDQPMRLWKVNLLNNYNEVINVYTITEQVGDTNSILIPDSMVANNAKLKMEIYCYDESNSITKIVREIMPIESSLENQYIPDYKYLNEVVVLEDLDTIVPKNCVCDIVSGYSLIPKSGEIGEYHFDTEGQLNKVSTLTGVDLLNGNANETYVNYTNGYLIIDNYDNDIPTFMVYKHNLATNTYTLLHTLARGDERTVAVNNNMVQINLEEFIFNPYGSNQLVKYNFKTNTITELRDIPMEITSSVLVKLEDGRILVIGNKTHLTKIYIIEEDVYIDSVSIVPELFVGKDLKVASLINKDSLIIINNGIDTGVLYFDRSTYILSEIDISIGLSNNTILPLNGEIALLGRVEEDYSENIPEHTTINLYK